MNDNTQESSRYAPAPAAAVIPVRPEDLFDTATPDELQQRLDLFRERYLLGLMSPPEFNDLLLEFQFGDSDGRTWSPGVNSRDWYVWREGVWQRAAPPGSLRIRNSTLWVLFGEQPADRADRADQMRSAIAAVSTPVTEPLIPVPPPRGPGWNQDDLPARPPIDPARPSFCPGCGQPAGNGKFCTKCGRQFGGVSGV